ncbi:MAG: hypothetical protein HY908_18880 [Myxococcales bacterium]|nr:hypothetical protein [Myxococcales bacterium]
MGQAPLAAHEPEPEPEPVFVPVSVSVPADGRLEWAEGGGFCAARL